jgi:ketosteroid isomerase-like protein
MPLSYGTLGREAAGHTLAASFAPRPAHVIRVEEVLAIGDRGLVGRTREVDREDGGEIEHVTLALWTVSAGRIDQLEYWEPHQLDAALARYRELAGP